MDVNVISQCEQMYYDVLSSHSYLPRERDIRGYCWHHDHVLIHCLQPKGDKNVKIVDFQPGLEVVNFFSEVHLMWNVCRSYHLDQCLSLTLTMQFCCINCTIFALRPNF